MQKAMLSLVVFLFLIGCRQETSEWNPIFEETHFNYFETKIQRSISLIDEAFSEADKNKSDAIKAKLYEAKNDLRAIKDYYIPLTTVRQKIYDADRYYKLNRIEDAARLLEDSKAMVMSLDSTARNKIFEQVIIDLNTKIDAVIIALDENSKHVTYDKMKILGEHVNIMLNKGELVLSGIEFSK